MPHKLTNLYCAHGRQANSGMHHFPDFQSSFIQEGAVFYQEHNGTIVIGSEPLASSDKLDSVFIEFCKQKPGITNFLALPVSRDLANSLKQKGFHISHLGVEPIFELKPYFKNVDRVYDRIHSAQKLLKDNAVVKEISASDPLLQKKLHDLYRQWMSSHTSPQLKFLNQVLPFEFHEHRKTFGLFIDDELTAFASGLNIPAVNGFYLCDIIKPRHCKPGWIEFLIIESMRTLMLQDYALVNLGLCPGIDLQPGDSKVLKIKETAQALIKNFYDTKGLYEFKNKLAPTRWEPMFLVSKEPIRSLDFFNFIHIQYGHSILKLIPELLKSVFNQFSIESLLRSLVRKTILVAPNLTRIPYPQMFIIFVSTLLFSTLFGPALSTESGLVYFMWYLLISLWILRALTRWDVTVKIVGLALIATGIAELCFSNLAPVLLFPTIVLAAAGSLFMRWKVWIPLAVTLAITFGYGLPYTIPLMSFFALCSGYYFGRRWI